VSERVVVLVKREVDMSAFLSPCPAEIVPVFWMKQFYDCGVVADE
jgi:hypothetical protein